MWSGATYYGGITSEQFLFYEIRTASKFYLEGKSLEEAKQIIKKDNLFQFPTERSVSKMVRSCYNRLDALENKKLYSQRILHIETSGPIELIGPEYQNLLGGQLSIYVKSKGEKGVGKVKITSDEFHKELQINVK